MNYYFYVDDDTVIRIKASRRPSWETRPKRGTWVVRELKNGNWEMPCFPEILWNTIKKLEYLGSRKVDNEA